MMMMMMTMMMMMMMTTTTLMMMTMISSCYFGCAVVTKLVKTRYHRIWVVRDTKPVGLLSLTDVFKNLMIPDDALEGGTGDCSIL
mmetsp:Transcript_4267/g.10335  ORF Transcript_4267/g.10335 Transcript_4267/m.10335 type:complete len:85 (+) Transcript_4267:2-256(+)